MEKALKPGVSIMANYELSASLICCDPLNIEREVKEIEKANIQYIHFDVMDGVFVPRYGLYPEMLCSLKKITSLPVDVHLMVINPEPYIQAFKEAGAGIIHVQAEGNHNLHRTVGLIRSAGVKAGVVLNIATPLNTLDYLLPDIDYVLLMAINPGIVGHKFIPQVYEKISQLEAKLKDHPIKIVVDGGVNAETAPKMIKQGTDILVCGTSSIFRPDDGTIAENTKKLRKMIDDYLRGM